MLLLGIDVGTSSIKVSVVDAQTQQCIASAQYPEMESAVIARQPGWAEQAPLMWCSHVQAAISKANATKSYNPADIGAIGITYQMHGLVCVDKDKLPLRDSIIWCDSRAVELGDQAFRAIGKEHCQQHLLNSPGNFTASKLAWVKQNEPKVYDAIHQMMLPGDFICMRLTGEINTSIAGLSEGVFWDFIKDEISEDVMDYYRLNRAMIPPVQPVFSEHGRLDAGVAALVSLPKGIPVTYKAGDQPNNALSLNVLQPGEFAATAGTSGVIYGVSDQLTFDKASRVNTFAHVNYAPGDKRLGVLMCINGTGSFNRWIKQTAGRGLSYQQMNDAAAAVNVGSDGLIMLPFGNGAERMLDNKTVQAHIHNIDLNKHTGAHLFRAAQEGVACAFRYGMDIMRSNGMQPNVIRAGRANMFLSDVFTQSFVNALQVPVELYDCDGSVGAAIGAGIGAGVYQSALEAFQHFKPVLIVEPGKPERYDELYASWSKILQQQLQSL